MSDLLDEVLADQYSRRIFEQYLAAQYLYDRDWRTAMLNIALVYDLGWTPTPHDFDAGINAAHEIYNLDPMPEYYPLSQLQEEYYKQSFLQ